MDDECVDVDDLRKHLESAKNRLSVEKAKILALHPLKDNFSREEYAFNYMRAERFGLRAINRRLTEVSWLPMQLDPRTEVLSESRASMKRWLTASLAIKPDSQNFGNDFIHALTRCSLEAGNSNPSFFKLSNRISNLFRELSCLIGLIYYCTWLAENNIEAIAITDPEDLPRTAEEIAELLQSPEILQYLRAKEQNDEKKSRSGKKGGGRAMIEAKKRKPLLHVITNPHFGEGLLPEPLPV